MSSVSTVGIVGPDDRVAVERAHAAVTESGATVRGGDVAAVLESDPEVIVAVGEPALLAIARTEPTIPVLPVGAGPGVRSVPDSAIESAVSTLLTDFSTVERQLLSVAVDGESIGPALFDVTLTTTEPGKISEYGVYTGQSRVGSFRADGVVVATPAGSHGYARNADGPIVAPSLDAVVVAPIAPFAIDLDHWVLADSEPVRLAVEREEASVSLLVDDRQVREIDSEEAVEITTGGSLSIAVVPESQPFFGEIP